ncbi:MAG: PorT family protein [Prevotella sp.]|nr:PorT family protein [Prevotella sp.]
MKKLALLAAFVCCTTVINAQNPQGKFSIKPLAGINVTGLSGGDVINGVNGNNINLYHYKVRFTAGVEAEYGVNDWLGVSLGAIYSQQGANIEYTEQTEVNQAEGDFLEVTEIDGNINNHYINVPLMANVYIPGVKGLALKTGIQVGFCLSSKENMNTNVYTVPLSSSQWTIIDYDSQKTFTELKDFCKTVDFGIPVGLSYEYKNIVLDARYYFGLTKIDKTEFPDDSRNRYLSVTLGYRFHL